MWQFISNDDKWIVFEIKMSHDIALISRSRHCDQLFKQSAITQPDIEALNNLYCIYS